MATTRSGFEDPSYILGILREAVVRPLTRAYVSI
jgi:hypothetical protein